MPSHDTPYRLDTEDKLLDRGLSLRMEQQRHRNWRLTYGQKSEALADILSEMTMPS